MATGTELDLRHAHIMCPTRATERMKKAVIMLKDEVEKRTRVRWSCGATKPAGSGPVILLSIAGAGAADGYTLRHDTAANTVSIIGNDERGVLFGVGRLLRSMRMETGVISMPAGLDVVTAPAYKLRGHQIGYRDKVNSYDGWDLPQWEQYLRDLAVFGTNAVEMIPPRSDDNATSVHFPRPPLEMMAGVSRLCDEYGLDFWLWYPALDEDYSKPATVEFALKEWREVLSALPRVNAILVPGGDPGGTPPRLLMNLLARQAEQLKSLHPETTWWVAPQGFSKSKMDEFVSILRDEKPAWLTGVAHGPWIHMTMAEFRALIPERYPIRNYPDITHTLSCQFPVPDWDIACPLTIGREPINPRPVDEAIIFAKSQPGTIGFSAYCEGCHDDVNKIVWSGLGWDPDKPVMDILREYSRYFIGETYTEDFAQGLLALERNWRGSVAANSGIYTTLAQFKAMEEQASPWTLKNWRFLQALYRAYYDAYVRSRLIYEMGLEEQAMASLRNAPAAGSLAAMADAERILNLATSQRVALDWRTRVFQLAEALFQSPAHMQLSVHLYQGQEEVRGANLDGIDFPLTNGPWLKDRCAAIRKLEGEAERLAAIKDVVEWTNPGPGGFYDDLGSSIAQPHVVKGPGYENDPAFLASPQHRFPYRKDPKPIRLSWRGFTGALNDAPFRMRYGGLDPAARYRVRVVYSDQAPHIKVKLDANGLEVHPWMHKPTPRQPLEFDVPQAATQGGELTLTWLREPEMGHSGTGAEVSEVWLIKVAA